MFPKIKLVILSIAVVLTTICILFLGKNNYTGYSWEVPKKKLDFGVIDAKEEFNKAQNINLESVKFGWNTTKEKIYEFLIAIYDKKRIPVVTVEPEFSFNEDKNSNIRALNQTRYDQVMINFCISLNIDNKQLYINFAPSPNNQRDNIWSTSDAGGYLFLYEKFVDNCKAVSKNYSYIWTPDPAGDFLKYKPVEEKYDIVGLTVYSDEVVDKLEYTFNNLFDPKYELLKSLKKNIMITQLGSAGTLEYQTKWMNNALVAIKNPNTQRYLRYVIYDSENWNTPLKLKNDPAKLEVPKEIDYKKYKIPVELFNTIYD